MMGVAMVRSVLAMVLFLVLLFIGSPMWAGPVDLERRIPVEDIDHWYVERFMGAPGLAGFVEGPRLQAGVPGPMAFDDEGNAYVAGKTFVFQVSADGIVKLIAGTPGMPGTSDGPASRAIFGSLAAITMGPDGAIYAVDRGNFCVKKVHQDESGVWIVTVVAGVPGKRGHSDGIATRSLLQRPDALTFDSKGNLYCMDQDWLRRVRDGQMTTLNPDGGSGFADGPLRSARFNRIMGGGAITCDLEDNLYIADRWNGVFRKVDLKKGVVSTFAGGPARGEPGFDTRGRGRTIDGPAMAKARFLSGGPAGVIYDGVKGRLFGITVDDWTIRVIEDGWVKSLGPWQQGRGEVLEGPVRKTGGSNTGLLGVDKQGRVYFSDGAHPAVVRRLYRKPPYYSGLHLAYKPLQISRAEEAPLRRARPTARQLGLPPDREKLSAGPCLLLAEASDYQVNPAVVTGYGEYYLVAWQEGYGRTGKPSHIEYLYLDTDGSVAGGEEFGESDADLRLPAVTHLGDSRRWWCACESWTIGQKKSDIVADTSVGASERRIGRLPATRNNRIQPTLASDGKRVLLVWSEYQDEGYNIQACLFGASGETLMGPFQVASSGSQPQVIFDGKQYVVAYERRRSVYLRRVSTKGELIDKSGIKIGGLFEHRPALATDGKVTVVTAARRPYPNPWGWNGPGAIAIGRFTRDGDTPDILTMGYDRLADAGIVGVVDAATWKGKPGWPAGIPGGFKGTEDGYWPHLYSAVCYDGNTYLVAWVRARMEGVQLVDFDIFGQRVSPDTMMPIGKPVGLVVGSGARSEPALASLGDGKSLLVWQQVQPDGSIKVAACFLAGGSTVSSPRVTE